MLFNSWQFALFFPIVVGAYWLLPPRARWAWLLAASCVFYAAFVPAYLLILFAVIAVDYAAGILIAGAEGAARTRWLGLSIVANLALLGTFKYYDFFAANARALGELIGWNLPLPLLQLLLPIGLSFHVFQSLSYTIEVYRGHQAAERHLGIYALYVLFWPQLVAGPIERPQNLLPQFHAPRAFSETDAAAGLRRMLWGFFKKIVVADRLALLVNPVFANPEGYSGLAIALAAVAFAFQIYCDFSGYSDIALGAARTMGYDLMENFKRPYFARSLQAFWTRWHISLSTWFRDYVYIPLGGNRVSTARWCLNLFVVFVVSGLWHGANWTYLAWGALHGGGLALGIVTAGLRERAYALTGLARAPRLLAALQIAAIFAFVTFAWVVFRAPSLAIATTMIARMAAGLPAELLSPAAWAAAAAALDPRWVDLPLGALAVVALLAGDAWQERGAGAAAWLDARPRWQRWAVYQGAIGAILLFGVFQAQPFIYFQF